MDQKVIKKNSKPPMVIKHTKTSLYRLIKSNPLMLLDDNTQEFRRDIDDLGLPSSILSFNSSYMKTSMSDLSRFSSMQSIPDSIKEVGRKTKEPFKKGQVMLPKKSNVKIPNTKTSTSNISYYSSLRSIPDCSKEMARKTKVPLKKEHVTLSKKRNTNTFQTKSSTCNLRQASSLQAIQDSTGSKTDELLKKKVVTFPKKSNINPTANHWKPPERKQQNFIRKNKMLVANVKHNGLKLNDNNINQMECNNQGNSKVKTATINSGSRKTMYDSKAGLTDLQMKLNDWLGKQGKSLRSYDNLLHGMSIEDEQVDENKENIEPDPPLRSDSYENLNLTFIHETDKLQIVDPIIANDALKDLYKLILNGYSKDKCETWLKLIKMKCKEIENEPEYWECKIAIDQLNGKNDRSQQIDVASANNGNSLQKQKELHNQDNILQDDACKVLDTNVKVSDTSSNIFSKPIKCYILEDIKEEEKLEDSVEQLFKKFSLLNINVSFDGTDPENHLVKTPRKRIEKHETKNELLQYNEVKGSIIKFAVKELQDKRKNPESPTKFLATPVKRSTRMSRSGYINTPDVKLCKSLKELMPDIRKSVNFKKNNALLD